MSVILRLKDKLKPLTADRAIRRLAVVAVLFDVIAWVLVASRESTAIRAGRIIALHYNVYLNVNDVGPAVFVLVAPILGTLIVLINFYLASRAYGPSRQNSLVILSVTVFYELLIAVATFFLVLVNLTH